MRLFQPDSRQRRTMGAVFAITFTTALLITAFFHTQVMAGEQYALRSEENRLRGIPIPAPRGTILDRNGEVIATSVTGYSVSLLPGDSVMIRETLTDLAPFLGLSGEEVARLLERREGRPNDLLEITNRATYAQAAAIEERRGAFPNVMVVERPQRYYPAGSAVGHIIGYVSEITREQLRQPEFEQAGYRQGALIGQWGVEREYETVLGGRDGARFVEVDARGRVVDPRATVGARAPVPGTPLQTTLDIHLQEYVASIFPDTMTGAVVAMVPSTGEILALYSHPSFDPNDFVGRISPALWSALTTDTLRPMYDRAITGLYPPASTFKLVTAAAALRHGIVGMNTRMPIACTGGLNYGGRYTRCWRPQGHGSLTLPGAIQHSCNVYFYQVGIRLGLAELAREGTRLGLARRTGIDLPNENAGIFPDGVEWYQRRFNSPAMPTDVLYLAIGQGPNSMSVIRMAHIYSALAGDGTAPPPHLVTGDLSRARGDTVDFQLDRAGLEALWEGLALVTEITGTALQSSLARYKLYGKTGTGQNPHGENHGVFIGFAGVPGGPPEIVVAAYIEHGQGGSDVAPLAAKIANFYLDRVHGHPFDPMPTLGERWRAGQWGQDEPNRRLVPPVE
jgi:penicillin-binding protein 2